MMKMKALSDLEGNMNRLEEIIVQKDQVVEGLKRQLEKALTRLENGESKSPEFKPQNETLYREQM
jgi:hypothetical protein